MPFSRRVIPPDPPPVDDSGELLLPDELLALGEQLRNEAAALAQQFPASGRQPADVPVEAAASPAARAPSWRARSAIAAALLVGAAAYAWVHTPWPEAGQVRTAERQPNAVVPVARTDSPEDQSLASPAGDRRGNAEPTSTDPPTRRSDRAPAGPPEASDHQGQTADSRPAPFDQTTPAVFLWEASGPELEGLLDLWEQGGVSSSSVSI